MAKICEICGKNIGMLGTAYTLQALDDRFNGYHNCIACLDCSDAISRTQDIVGKGITYLSEKENYNSKLKVMLTEHAGKNANENIKTALQLLLKEAMDASDNYVEPEPTPAEEKRQEPAQEAAVEVTIDEELYGTPIYTLHGCRGRHLFVFEDFVVIKTVLGLGSLITGNATDGEKVILYKDCIGLQYKEPRLTLGYLQMETASGQMNNQATNQFGENTFTFEVGTANVRMVYKHILGKVAATKR